VADTPDLAAIARQEMAYPQVEVDLHLSDAQSPTDHETRADWFGFFVARMSAAVNEVTKSLTKKRRLTPGLRVLAPTPGSVRVVLRAPMPHGEPQDAIAADDTSAESQALRVLAGMFVMAEDDDLQEDSPLTATAQSLTPIARQRVRTVAKSIVDAGWQVEGSVSQRGREVQPLRINARSAQRLFDELNKVVQTTTAEVRQGTIDGQRHSLSTMWFIPDGQKRAIEVAVTDFDLLEEVTRLSAIEGMTVRCNFTVFLSIPAGSSEATSRSYELEAIEPIAPQESFPI
jgi:hypothetical protein